MAVGMIGRFGVEGPLTMTMTTRDYNPSYSLWCQSSKHHQLCIAEIGRPNLAFFLIPLTKVVLLVIQTNLSDRFLIGSKLGEL